MSASSIHSTCVLVVEKSLVDEVVVFDTLAKELSPSAIPPAVAGKACGAAINSADSAIATSSPQKRGWIMFLRLLFHLFSKLSLI